MNYSRSALLLCALFSIKYVYKIFRKPCESRLPLNRRDVFDLIVVIQPSQKSTDERTFLSSLFCYQLFPGTRTSYLPRLDGQLDLGFSSQSSDVQLCPRFVLPQKSSHIKDLSRQIALSDTSVEFPKLPKAVINTKKSHVSRMSKLKHAMNTGT